MLINGGELTLSVLSGVLGSIIDASTRDEASEAITSDRLLSIGELGGLGVDKPSCPVIKKRTPLALAFKILDQEPLDETEDESDAAGPGVEGDRMDDCVEKEALESARTLVPMDWWRRLK